jgi:hypothetical protein
METIYYATHTGEEVSVNTVAKTEIPPDVESVASVVQTIESHSTNCGKLYWNADNNAAYKSDENTQDYLLVEHKYPLT